MTVSLPGYVRTNAHERAGLNHLTSKIPDWMWLTADRVVAETEQASFNGKSEIIPGLVYKIAAPFLRYKNITKLWSHMTKK